MSSNCTVGTTLIVISVGLTGAIWCVKSSHVEEGFIFVVVGSMTKGESEADSPSRIDLDGTNTVITLLWTRVSVVIFVTRIASDDDAIKHVCRR